jgi:peptide chain release factor 2
MEPLKKQYQDLFNEIKRSIAKLGIVELEKERNILRREMAQPGFWDDNLKAQELSKKEADLSRKVEPWLELKKAEDMINLTNDESLKEDLSIELVKLQKQYDGLKKELRFQGPYDGHNVILSVYAGAGGTDAQDWAQMLLRMYVRWAESHNLKVQTIDQTAGEEAGIKSVTLELSGGNFLYGKLAGEHGVHRLVRLSPFNANNLRQTSFAKVEILPVIDKPEEVELDEKDLKVDVFRAGGHGGQSVNTTDSAVRVTHIPTGITVAIQNERSQLQNKETALTILRSRLAALQLEQHAKNVSELKGPNQSAEWGNQIRSYVIHPYKQVKDLRTGYETSDAEKVLDGSLDAFIDAWLEHNME